MSVNADHAVLAAADTGGWVDLCPDSVLEIGQGANWGQKRTVSAEVLTDLITVAGSGGGRLWPIKVRGARVVGVLDLEAATLARSLHLTDCYFDEPVNLEDVVAISISLSGCHVPSISAKRLSVRGTLVLDRGFTARGGVVLTNAHIGATLNLDGAQLSNPNGPALQAPELTVDGAVLCGNGFVANGGVRLHGAHLGSLGLEGATFNNPGGDALLLRRVTIDSGVFGRDGLTVRGTLNLVNARVRGTLILDGAQLVNPDGLALQAVGLRVDGSMLAGAGFTAHGKINLFYATIAGRLDFRDALLPTPGAFAVNLERVETTTLYLQPRQRPAGTINLTNARVGNFFDDEKTWPAAQQMRGLVYDSLDTESVDVHARLRWLQLHDESFAPGNYDQLADTYRRSGQVEASRLVSLTKYKRRRRHLHPAGKIWNWLLYLTVGYGYRTWWAGLWLLGLIALGSVIFAHAHPRNMRQTSPADPAFQPIAFTIDTLLPVVDLGQQGAWHPLGVAQVWAWVLTSAGWILTTAVLAGLTNALKRV